MFQSRFVAGFECSTHRRRDGARVDVVHGSGHDLHAEADYRQARELGMDSARDGLRWHLIEPRPGVYDWSSWSPLLDAAFKTGMQVVWDLWHYGTPDWLDIWSETFTERFAAFAAAAARHHRKLTDVTPCWCPLNEMSFYSFIAGEVGDFHPYALERGHEMKRQLVRAAVAGARRLREVDPRCRLLWAEPLIHVAPVSVAPADIAQAYQASLAQFQVFDMIAGRMDPELGGSPDLLDVVGCNYYPQNQWKLGGGPLPLGHHDYRPLSWLLLEVARRYGRPMAISETGAEGSARAAWLHYVCQEVAVARDAGAPIEAVCLYPVTNYPGWDDDRDCATGLFGRVENGARPVHVHYANELRRQADAWR